MSYVNGEALVSTDWLAENLDKVKVLDASHFVTAQDRDADEEFIEEHIPGAVRFDVDKVCATGTDLPHMIPTAEAFSSAVRKMGIGDGDHVVVYDSVGVATAACRVWWMFRLFGHERVSVLDGGFPKWLREGRDVEAGEPEPVEAGHYTARFNPSLLRTVDQVAANLETKAEQVVDARSASRFQGVDPEPRPSKRLGHIPGSLNVPFLDILDKREMTFLPAAEIERGFTDAGVDLSAPITATCGSGITACVDALALYLIGRTDVPVYDGSWAEWNVRAELPVDGEVDNLPIE